MIESKAWKWEIVSKDDKYWNTPAKEVFYLAHNWKEKGYKDFLDVGCVWQKCNFYGKTRV